MLVMMNKRFEKIYKKSIKLYSLYFKCDFKSENFIINYCKNLKENRVCIKDINDAIIEIGVSIDI